MIVEFISIGRDREMNCKRTSKERRDVVVVGMKLRPSSRELLTWTLAKFTKPGDQVVALHVATKQQFSSFSSGISCSNQALLSGIQYTTQGEVEGIFDSVIGVYDGFCRIKQIKLQLKVVSSGSSVRRTLVEEVRHHNAIRLILGAPKTQRSEKSSLTLAKYCSAHLPSTCSILVIQHGQMVFEKAGILTSGVDSKGVTLSSLQIMKEKTSGLGVSKNARKEYNVQNQDESEKNQCIHFSSSSGLDVSRRIFHPYKYVPPQIQGLQSSIVELEKLSPMPAISPPRMRCDIPSSVSRTWSQSPSKDNSLKNICYGNELSKNHSSLDKPVQHCILSNLERYWHEHTSKGVHNRGWPLVKTGCNLLKSSPSNMSSIVRNSNQGFTDTHHPSKEGHCKTQKKVTRGNRYPTSDIPRGWPFLHQSIAATKLDNSHSSARRMSVVEWVLQLPERPNGVRGQKSGPTDQEISACSTRGNEQNLLDLSNQETKQEEVGIFSEAEAEAEATLLEKCHLLCKRRDCLVFKIADLEKSTNGFSKDNMIGKGGCSQVYRGVLSDARVVAIKCFDMSPPLAAENEFLTELEIVSSMHHHYIVELLGYCVENQQRCLLVYNFATEGSLEQRLNQADDKAVLPWSIRYKVALGIGEALEYLHNSVHPVIHRDVKSSNILLQSDFTPQLTDFGLSKWACSDSTFVTCSDIAGTFGYLAPEYFMFGKVSDKTDVYSFGVVLLELVSGRHPIKNVGSNGQGSLILWARSLLEDESKYEQVVDRRLGKEFDGDQLKNMLIAASLCLQQSPHTRPSINTIIKVLRGDNVDLESRQDSMCIDGDLIPSYGRYDIHNHLMLALYGLDEDLSLQAGNDQNACCNDPNKLIEEYLQG